MPYNKRIVATAVLLSFGLFIYVWLTGISDRDIYAYHRADYETGDRQMAPGSIAAVSPKGNISEICSLKAGGLVENGVHTSLYYNVLREDFPSYVKSIKFVAWAFGDTGQESTTPQLSFAPNQLPASGREFRGSELVIKNLAEANQFAEPDCETRMAWHLSNGYKVCTVRKSLNKAVLGNDGTIRIRTVAVAFAEHSNFVGESTFVKGNIDYNEQAQIANGQPCEGSPLPLSAKVRRWLELIDRVAAPA
ncbi:hypothetical protein C1J03_06635 [Sulfitobacter sp. SK012]|uniref:hypothetical protein n=1 Tax=Sulfitobacter sp. SK012 TaxID=1389005 RepID=UPI000E0B7728|nr:hypothetical protein [Sulfitobacter sp. SK012]AXI45736.1 hypothetical protein C1J03_06635 [Sulfitobacter sp. SK012]